WQRRPCTAALAAAAFAATLAAPGGAAAQDGPGTSGAQVLQLPAGSRAAGFSGAYAAGAGDADLVFYNPAGLLTLSGGFSAAYQRHVAGISLGSAAGALRVGDFALGLGVSFLDAGDIEVVEPDPDLGGQRGRKTGETASARETAVRLAAALPLARGRLRVGAGLGLATTDLAGLSRSAPLADAGVQLELPYVTLGAALRNLGGSLSGDGAEDAPLPTELRLGAAFELAAEGGLGLLAMADLVSQLREGGATVLAGVEAGWLRGQTGRLGAVARIGYDGWGGGDSGLGALRLGAGLALGRLALDYTYQNLDFFGAVHRLGVRWSWPNS
ncbi:MAG: hypothetical protein HY703_01710, partial [Gemmatimonadetes bacterium]|nr:hypothetical protein [Gemmatimonadota bacterium]